MSTAPDPGLRVSPVRPFAFNGKRTAYVVRLPEDAVVPQSCANCGEHATATQAEDYRGQSLLVPYCDGCGVAAAGVGTLRLASTVASTLLVTTLLLVLPGWFSRLGLAWSVVLVLAVGALPVVIAGWVRRGFAAPRTAATRAVFWLRPNVIACFNRSWAAALAQTEESKLEVVRIRERVLTLWMWSAVALGVALLPRIHAYLMPTLVALNFGTSPVALVFESGERVQVDPTSLESERAGSRLRVPAGLHKLTLESIEGQLIEEREVRVRAGALHLLSVSGGEYCFWLEQDRYGQTADKPRDYRLLDPSKAFWAIDERVDSLFASNPQESGDRSSSGGTMTALRQARCAELPPELGRTGLPGSGAPSAPKADVVR